jgi:hypothetical protein
VSIWYEMESAPKDKSVLLFNKHSKTMWIGRKRYGLFGEPQQEAFVWRCDSSGRFCTPTHWAPKPKEPKDAQP